MGPTGQERLRAGSVLVVGCGGLGSWASSLLVRAGVGRVRLVDDDRVDWTNLARQAMYTQADAQTGRLKVEAAAERLAEENDAVVIEPVAARATPANIATLAEGVDVVLDGSDDWQTRFLMNDLAVRDGLPWIWGGVVECVGQVMTILPGETACLQCVYEGPPPPAKEQAMKASVRGVLGPAVAMIAAVQSLEVIKILSGQRQAIRRGLWQVDLWGAASQSLAARRDTACSCCGNRLFAYLRA